MMQVFDSGYLFGVAAGSLTPVKFGSLQGVKALADFKLNPVQAQLQSPSLYLIDGLGFKFTAKAAQINGLLMNTLFFGEALSQGSYMVSRDNSITVPSGKTWHPHGTFAQDLGVQYSGTGIQLTTVPAFITPGTYTVSNGTYTFADADVGKTLIISYLYFVSTGNRINLQNRFKGPAPSFQAILQGQYDGKQVVWNLNRCVSRQLMMNLVLENFTIPEFSFDAIGDQVGANGSIGVFSYSD